MTSYLLDTNAWLALALSAHFHHRPVGQWLEGIERSGSVFFCRATQLSFLRLLTNAAVLSPYGNRPLTNDAAWAAYEALLADDRIAFWVEEPHGLDRRWKSLAARRSASPKLWMDAYLAAFAIEAECRLVTTDAAFRQFTALDLVLLERAPAAE